MQATKKAITPNIYASLHTNWETWFRTDTLTVDEAKRSFAVFTTGGAPGTGKTTFGRHFAELLLQHRDNTIPLELIKALTHCCERQLTFSVDLEERDSTSDMLARLWRNIVTARFTAGPSATQGVRSVRELFDLIYGVEQQVASTTAMADKEPLAIVIHLDEAHLAKPEVVDAFILEVLTSVFPRAFHSAAPVFPIIYVSGLDRLKIQERASVLKPQRVFLPLLSRDDLNKIVRELFKLPGDWHARGGLKRAFNCFGGVPRLFLYFLWVLSLDDEARNRSPAFPHTPINLVRLRYRLTEEYGGCKSESDKPPMDYCDSDLHFCVQQLYRSSLWSSSLPAPDLIRRLVYLVVTQLPDELDRKLVSMTIADDSIYFKNTLYRNGRPVTVNDLISDGLAYADTVVDAHSNSEHLYIVISII